MKQKSRLTISMTPEEHKNAKAASDKLGMTLREFIRSAAFSKIRELEEINRFQRSLAMDHLLDSLENNEFFY
jgi:hypothetical protein